MTRVLVSVVVSCVKAHSAEEKQAVQVFFFHCDYILECADYVCHYGVNGQL